MQSNLKELFERTKHILEKNNKKKLKLSDEIQSSGTTSRRLLKGLGKQIIFNPPRNTTDRTKSTILNIVKKKRLNDQAANKSSGIKPKKKKKIAKERTEGSVGKSKSKQKIKRVSMDDGSSSKFKMIAARSAQANSPFIEPRYHKIENRENNWVKHPAYTSNMNQSSTGTFRRILTKRIQNINSKTKLT